MGVGGRPPHVWGTSVESYAGVEGIATTSARAQGGGVCARTLPGAEGVESFTLWELCAPTGIPSPATQKKSN